MQSQLFMIAAGGTGLRCLEAVVQLAALGLFEDRELHLMSLDTDHQNGNKSRTERLIDLYQRVKGGKDHQSQYSQSLFSSRIHVYRVGPTYSGARRTFRESFRLDALPGAEGKQTNDLAHLLLDSTAQDFKLEHGYRAQTHIGSQLKYTHFLDDIRQATGGGGGGTASSGDLMRFVDELQKADSREPTGVFMFGSIFGGTGASSIPVLPRALQDALLEKSQGKQQFRELYFGAALLTPYFSFASPKTSQLQAERIVADAAHFNLNAKAALNFYLSDRTIQQLYRRLYLIGWPSDHKDYSASNNEPTTLTGGEQQRNPAHATELLAAFAALDFFSRGDGTARTHEMVYRSVEQEGTRLQFHFADFAGDRHQAVFRQRLLALTGLAVLTLKEFDGNIHGYLELLARKHNTPRYSDASREQTAAWNEFVRQFLGKPGPAGLEGGWLRQVIESTGQAECLLNARLFARSAREFKDFNWGQLALPAEAQYHFTKKGWLSTPDAFDEFNKVFVKTQPRLNTGNRFEEFLNATLVTFEHLHSGA